MLRGENVGAAYVRIFADGSGLDEEIKQGFADADDDVQHAGDRHSKMYGDAYDKGIQKQVKSGKLQKSLAKGLADIDLINEFLTGDGWIEFRRGLNDSFGEAGDRAGHNLEQNILSGMSMSALKARLTNVRGLVMEAVGDIVKDENEAARIAERLRINDLRELRQELTMVSRSVGDLGKGGEGSRKELMLDLTRIRQGLADVGEENKAWLDKLDDTEHRLRRTHPLLDGFIHRVDLASDAIGKGFGRGSRNDFLNFIGSVARNLSNLAFSILPRTARAFLNWSAGVREAFAQGIGPGFAKLGTDFIKVLGGMGAAAVGLFGVIGPLVSLLSLAAGAVTALASSLTVGLIGAAGAAAGALVPLAGWVAALVLGFKNLEGESKTVAKEIGKSFKSLGDAAAEGLQFDRTQFDDSHSHAVHSFADVLRQVKSMVDDLQPLMRIAGRAVADAMDRWVFRTTAARGAWTRFVDAIDGDEKHFGFLGNSVRRVGTVIGQTFDGLLGVFRGLIPITDRFLKWAVDLSGEFSKWANSPRGIQEMHRFFAQAADSAASLGGFLAAVWDLLGEIVTAGSRAGDSIFDSMTRGIEGWTKAIQDNPDILSNWFKDAEKFAGVVGDLIVGLGRLFDVLDSEWTRTLITVAFEGLSSLLKTTSTLLKPLADLFNNLSGPMQEVVSAAAAAAFVFPRFNNAISTTKGRIGDLVTSLGDAPGRMNAFKSAAKSIGGTAGLAGLMTSLQSSNREVKVLGSTLSGAAIGFSVGGPWGAAIGAAGGALMGFMHKNESAAVGVDTLTASLDKQTGAMTKNTKELVANSLEKSGILDIAREAGIGLDLVTSAASGNQKSLRELGSAWQFAHDKAAAASSPQEAQKWLKLADNIAKVNVAAQDQAGKLDDAAESAGRMSQALGKTIPVTQAVLDKMKGWPKKLVTQIDTLGAPATLRGIQQVTRKFDLMPKKVRTLMELAGIEPSRRAIQLLRDGIKKVPRRVETRLATLNYKPTVDQLKKLKKQYDLNDRQVEAIIKATGIDVTLRDLKKVQSEGDKAGKKKIEPRADLKDSEFQGKLKGLNNDLDRTGRRKVSPSVGADAGGFFGVMESVRSMINNIDKSVDIYVTTHYQTVGNPPGRGGGGASGRTLADMGPETRLLTTPTGTDVAVTAFSLTPPTGAVPTAPVTAAGKTVNVGGITVVSPSADPRAVAAATINHLAAVGY